MVSHYWSHTAYSSIPFESRLSQLERSYTSKRRRRNSDEEEDSGSELGSVDGDDMSLSSAMMLSEEDEEGDIIPLEVNYYTRKP